MRKAVMYFSPTKSGEKIALRLKSLLNIEVFDITLPKKRLNLEVVKDVDLLYLIVPVYGQNFPHILKNYFCDLKYSGSLVLIAVYGNVHPGGTLKYLMNTFKRPIIAGASFIGSHSYNDSSLKLGDNRPNEEDLKKLNQLIQVVDCRLENKISIKVKGRSNIFALVMPKIILRFSSKIPKVNKECQHCKACQIKCPTGAIKDDLRINKKLCCHCYCCTLVCKASSRKRKISFFTRYYLKRHINKNKQVIIY